jgi:hypothetical protein
MQSPEDAGGIYCGPPDTAGATLQPGVVGEGGEVALPIEEKKPRLTRRQRREKKIHDKNQTMKKNVNFPLEYVIYHISFLILLGLGMCGVQYGWEDIMGAPGYFTPNFYTGYWGGGLCLAQALFHIGLSLLIFYSVFFFN